MITYYDHHFSHPRQSLDFAAVTTEYDEELTRYFDDWTRRFATESDMTGNLQCFPLANTVLTKRSDPACAFRATLLPL